MILLGVVWIALRVAAALWVGLLLWRLARHTRWFIPAALLAGGASVFELVYPSGLTARLTGVAPPTGGDVLIAAFRLLLVAVAERALAWSERKQDALIEAEERYHRATRAGMVGVWEYDLVHREVLIDPILKRLLGFEDWEISTRADDWNARVHPEDRGALHFAVEEATASRQSRFEVERRMIHKSGATRTFLSRGEIVPDEKGDPVRLIGADCDITERKEAQDELEKTRRHLEFLVEERTSQLRGANVSLQNEIAQRERAEGALRVIAEGTSPVTGTEFFRSLVRSVAEAMGVKYVYIGRLISPEDRSRIRVVAFWQDGTLHEDLEFDISDSPCRKVLDGYVCLQPRDARVAYPESSRLAELGVESCIGVPVETSDGEIIGHLMAMHVEPIDGAERMVSVMKIAAARASAEFARQKFEAALRQAHKMQAVGVLAGGVAHDFNNILTTIILNAEMALGAAGPDSPIADHLREVLWSGDRGRDLVKQILSFSRGGEGRTLPLEMSLITKEALKLLRSTLPRNIEITENVAPKAGQVLADPSQVQQVIVNLATNAFEAIGPEGGRIEVAIQQVSLSEAQAREKPLPTAGDYIVLSVSDDGPGVPVELRERIFEPFFSTKSAGRGSGLGLSVVHGIVARHGGAIEVETSSHGGARFVVYWPRHIEARQRRDLDGDVRGASAARILFVDDEQGLVHVAGQALEMRGYDVVSKSDSRDCLAEFEANPETFDLAILDVTMPHVSGVEVARRMLELRPGFPVILATGYSELITRESALKMGVRELVPKPYSMQELDRLIRVILQPETT